MTATAEKHRTEILSPHFHKLPYHVLRVHLELFLLEAIWPCVFLRKLVHNRTLNYEKVLVIYLYKS